MQKTIPGLLMAIAMATPALAAFDPSKEYQESAVVAAHFPDPAIELGTPAFKRGRTDFTSQEELIDFVNSLAVSNADLRVQTLGKTQEGRAIPLLIFSRPAAGQPTEMLRNGKPTVLIIGQQHGNEPAGGEAALALATELGGPAAALLDRVNVLIVPRANPDGAFHFVRGLADGTDPNRDHVLLSTPEIRALAKLFSDFQPDVVLDCHEFSVVKRWFEKFQAIQQYDALIQFATVPNLPVALAEATERLFHQPLQLALEKGGFKHSWYYTTKYDLSSRLVSMGGVGPDTGRNVAGLRNTISFLIETRGVNIGRAHYKRRVTTHLTAMKSILLAAAEHGDEILALGKQVRSEVAGSAGRGQLVVAGEATQQKHTLTMMDPDSGEQKAVEVDWMSALNIETKLQRPRPYGYLLAASELPAAERLRLLGLSVYRLNSASTVDAQRYRVISAIGAKKDDVRRKDDEAGTSIVKLRTNVEAYRLQVQRGDFYIPMDQPLANLASAALEPETEISFAANQLLTLPSAKGNDSFLMLYRLPARLAAPMTVWDGH